MQAKATLSKTTLSKTILSLTALATLLLAAPHAACAQSASLSLTPSVSTATAGQTVTFTVVLNGGGDLGVYDFNVFLGSANLSYVGGSTSAFVFNPSAGFTFFPGSSVSGNDLEVSAGYPLGTSGGTAVNVSLGSFSVVYGGAVTVPVTTGITFGVPGLGVGQSQVNRHSDNANELTGVTGASLVTTPVAAAPEPSGALALMVGVGLMAGAAWRSRRRIA